MSDRDEKRSLLDVVGEWKLYDDGDVKLREYEGDKGFGITVNGIWIRFTRAETLCGLTRFYKDDVHIGAVRRDDLPHGAVKVLDEVADDVR